MRDKGEQKGKEMLAKWCWLLVIEIAREISSHLVVYFVLLHTQNDAATDYFNKGQVL